METRRADSGLVAPALVLACLSCLQPGIDPVFLTLISSAHGIPSGLHGWIVAATQFGMALGSLAAWRLGIRLPARALTLAALAALAASAATVHVDDGRALLGLRFGYGLAMGLLYTQAMTNAAAHRPAGAYAAVFLLQLLLSTAAALLLPAVSLANGPKAALATLCAVPIAALAITLISTRATTLAVVARPLSGAEPAARRNWRARAAAWALALATLFFIGATMMVWSFTGTMAMEAGIGDAVVGRAVAVGSIAGAVTALAVMRERTIVPPPVSGALAVLTLLCPILVTKSGGDGAFVLGIVLFNVGSTAIIVRCSGLASAASLDMLFRRFVSCTHPLGMTLGPVAASISTLAFGPSGLLFAAITVACAGCAMLLLGDMLRRTKAPTPASGSARMARRTVLRRRFRIRHLSQVEPGCKDFAPAKK